MEHKSLGPRAAPSAGIVQTDTSMGPADIVPHFATICPSFADVWRAHRESPEWEPLPFVDVGQFARHLVSLYRSRHTSELPATFAEIERLLTTEPQLRDLLVVGLLEGIQNHVGNAGLSANVLSGYMGAHTLEAWDDLNGFWGQVHASLDEPS